MTDNVPSGPCGRLSWCRIHHLAASTDVEHVGTLLDLSDLTHRMSVVRWQSERDGALRDVPKIRITYGPAHSTLSPAWLDLTLSEADILAEILGCLTLSSAAGLINGLYELAH
jgi:hypothetical protein